MKLANAEEDEELGTIKDKINETVLTVVVLSMKRTYKMCI